MKNPMENKGVFNVEDVQEYKEYLEDSILQSWNDYCPEGLEVSSFDEVDMDDEGFADEFCDIIDEYEEVSAFLTEVENYGGCVIVHEDEFQDYCRSLVEDEYNLREVPDFIMYNVDWEGVSMDLKIDYTCIEYNGQEFYTH